MLRMLVEGRMPFELCIGCMLQIGWGRWAVRSLGR